MKSILYVGNMSQNIPTYIRKLFLREELGLFFHFDRVPCSWIGIRIPNTNTDLGEPNQYGYGSAKLGISTTGTFLITYFFKRSQVCPGYRIQICNSWPPVSGSVRNIYGSARAMVVSCSDLEAKRKLIKISTCLLPRRKCSHLRFKT
jgi:hypothetical protein